MQHIKFIATNFYSRKSNVVVNKTYRQLEIYLLMTTPEVTIHTKAQPERHHSGKLASQRGRTAMMTREAMATKHDVRYANLLPHLKINMQIIF